LRLRIIFFKERWYGFDDALYTGARLLEILSKTNKTCEQVFANLPDSINTPEINIHFGLRFFRCLPQNAVLNRVWC
jgi:phosphomannomutase